MARRLQVYRETTLPMLKSLDEEGRLRVVGGIMAGQKYLRDMETFDGKKWVRDSRGLRTGRKGFSLVKIPADRFRKMSVKSKRVPRRNKISV